MELNPAMDVIDPFGWTVERLQAIAGEPGGAERLAAKLLQPSGKWRAPWLLEGLKSYQAHTFGWQRPSKRQR